MKCSRKLKSAFKIAAIAGALCTVTSMAIGDEVILKDGTVYTGTVVSQNRRNIEIDTKVHGISTRLTIDRRKVKSIVKSDTTNTAVTPETVDAPPATIPQATEPVEEDDKVLKRDGYNLILEVPMEGTFGKDIYPLGIANSLEWAVENGVTDVVFRIDSGGGALWCSSDMVDIMKDFKGELKMHMLIESAISASIWPAFTCDTITMTPGSDFGGAVAYTTNDTGSTEVDLKMNSIRSAKLESAADANGYSAYIVRAMTLSAAAVYAYKSDGEWVLTDNLDDIPTSNYDTIDGPDTVLTLTAKQAIKYGIVTAMEDGRTLDEWAQVQGIEKWDNAGTVGHEIIERDVEKSKKLQGRLMSTYRGFISSSIDAGNSGYVSGFGASLQSMRKQLGMYKRLLKQCEDLHMPSIYSSFEEAIDIDYWETEIENRMADLRRLRRRGP
jgi:hypothetical protein